MPADLPSKPCASCGRVITWRKSWARTWEQVTFCSQRCRTHKVSVVDRQLADAIVALLATRPAGATICPSEAARLVSAENWRDLMEPARSAARRLVNAGQVQITQGGAVVDPSTATGPIRIRLVHAVAEPERVPSRKRSGAGSRSQSTSGAR
jgi:hypothetical protein